MKLLAVLVVALAFLAAGCDERPPKPKTVAELGHG
jgi:hypothetical protein